jgi:hypothetical protein
MVHDEFSGVPAKSLQIRTRRAVGPRCTSLNRNFGTIFAVLDVRDKEISPDELYAHLLRYDVWHDKIPQDNIGSF